MRFLEALRTTIDFALDAVLPPRARSARTKVRRAEDIPLIPTTHDLLDHRITTLMDYRQEAVQDLIRSLKYDRSRHAAKLAADLLADYLREECASLRTFSQKLILLIPVPLHKARQRERGYNQIALVLEALPQEFKDGSISRIETTALARTRATDPQTKLNRAARIKNVVGAFEAADAATVRNAHIFLIDDVTTTGATLINAGKPLLKVGANVTLLALARA